MDCQQLIFKYFKHILVLFIELVNFQNSHNSNEPQQKYEKRKDVLISQVQALANWVMQFNPKEFVKNAEMI